MEELSRDWEKSFQQLNKELFSADAVKGYRIEDFFTKFATPASRILDYGCGKGRDVERLRAQGFSKSFGTDPSLNLLSNSPLLAEGTLRPMQGTRIPFADNEFDLVYCSGVLHHIEWAALPGVFSEIHRVLGPGGKFLFVEPRDSWARRFGHTFVFSPVRRLVPQVNVLADCLKAEWPTYSVWLKREPEIQGLIEASGLRRFDGQRRLVTWLEVFEK